MKEQFQRERTSHYESTERHRLGGSTDLAALCSFVLVAAVVLVVWNPAAPPIRAIVGVPLLFLAPGYALVSVLFPHANTAPGVTRNGSAPSDRARQVTEAERIALSFGSSLAILPLLSLPLASVAGFSSESIVVAVSGFALLGAAVAWIRRRRIPPARRYRPSFAPRLAGLRSFLFPRESPLLAMTNLALAISVVLAMTTGGYALLAPQDGERYTGMQLLSEDASGELVAAGYPSEIESGEMVPITVAVENQEQRDVTYDLVVVQERFVDGSLVDRGLIYRTDVEVADGETVYSELEVRPTVTDGQVRIVYLLYEEGEVPDDPRPGNAYRYTHLWIDVVEPAETGFAPPDDDDEEDSGDDGDTGDGDTGDGDGDSGDGDGDTGDGGGGDGDGGSGDGGGNSSDNETTLP